LGAGEVIASLALAVMGLQASKVIAFIDLAGHEKYLKTTIYGMTSHAPDYGMLMIGGNMGIVGMTKGMWAFDWLGRELHRCMELGSWEFFQVLGSLLYFPGREPNFASLLAITSGGLVNGRPQSG
jgi:hypothetical protein